MLGLGRHSKEAGDEGDLPGDVSFAHPADLSLAGSGSLEQDGPLCIVAMKKEEQTRLMQQHRLGKR